MSSVNPDKMVPTHWSTMLFASVFLVWQSLFKGYLVLFSIPLLFIVIPILYWTRSLVRRILARGTVSESAWRYSRLQLIGILTFYFFMPCVGDGNPVINFPLFVGLDTSSPLVLVVVWAFLPVTFVLCVGGLISFIWSTGAIFTLYSAKPGGPAKIGLI